MNLLIGAATIGLILAPLALGVFLSYRVYRTLDLTTDGSYGLGAAVVAALLVREFQPLAATGLAALAGVLAGGITGILHTRFRVGTLLAGVLTSTALYSVNLFVMGSGNLSLIGSETLLSLAERIGGPLFGLPASVTLYGTAVSQSHLVALFSMGLLVAALALGLALFLGTDVGLAMRATGSNPQMAKAIGIDVDRMTVIGLALSNGLIALSGSLLAQYEGFANIQMGIGAIVTGVATLMLGETLLGRRSVVLWIAGAVVGAIVFRMAVAAAIQAGLHPNALKLVTAAFVLAVLVLPATVQHARRRFAAEAH